MDCKTICDYIMLNAESMLERDKKKFLFMHLKCCEECNEIFNLYNEIETCEEFVHEPPHDLETCIMDKILSLNINNKANMKIHIACTLLISYVLFDIYNALDNIYNINNLIYDGFNKLVSNIGIYLNSALLFIDLVVSKGYNAILNISYIANSLQFVLLTIFLIMFTAQYYLYNKPSAKLPRNL